MRDDFDSFGDNSGMPEEGLGPWATDQETSFHRLVNPPPQLSRSSHPWHTLRRRWKWAAGILAGVLVLAFLFAPVDGPIGTPFLRSFQHLHIPDPSHPTDSSLAGSSRHNGSVVMEHRVVARVTGLYRTSHLWRIRLQLTNRGSEPLLAEVGMTAELTIRGREWSPINPEASANDFYTAINPGQTVTGWLVFPVSRTPSGPVALTLPHLFRLNTPLWTLVIPLH